MAAYESVPTRNTELLVVAIIMLFLSSFFAIWRLIVRCKGSFWMGPSDWLMILGATLCNAGMIAAIVTSFHGAGRLLRDPFWDPNPVDKMAYVNQVSFASQMLNIYGIFVVKLSICAYLLILNFSQRYKWVIWGTVVFITIFNFILPVILHFGSCRTFASGWDIRVADKECWPQAVRTSIATSQSVSNIISDLVYATAPVVYIRSVQLSRRTQWSVRAVFLMSILCTTISAIKLWDYFRVISLDDPYYETVTLSIWSMTEVTTGIVVANLPPLRKSFDGLFKRILPANIATESYSRGGRSDRNQENYGLRTYQMNNIQLREPPEDNESDKAILSSPHDDKIRISKTTEIVISEQKTGTDDWRY